MRFPRTILGWCRLFWLTIRRCPICHSPLLHDLWLYDDGNHLFCLYCGGMRVPKGFFRALIENEIAHKQKDGADGN